MDVKGANPFLFTEEDYVSPNSGSSNPFLLENEDFTGDTSGANDNPFLSQNAATVASNSSTNPFAFDPMDFGPMEAQSAEVSDDQTTFMANTFIDASAKTANDIFSDSVQDFLTDVDVPLNPIPQKPTDLDLKFTNSVASDDDFTTFTSDALNQSGTKRPLPPRPPPSKETQDLLMSVMGAMDATSSHLLDRIPPTRTPSPVSMRDLHSPSPTPEPFGDLLDVSDSKPNSVSEVVSNKSEDLLMSLDQKNDINENPTVDKPNKFVPQRPGPPARPPRPNLPPPKPSPPVFAQPNSVTQTTNNMPPQKPPPPILSNNSQPTNQVTEIMDMFGTEDIPKTQKTVSTTDIMNLYNAPPVPQVTDLLCDTVEEAADTSQSAINNSMQTESFPATTLDSIQETIVNNVSAIPEDPIITSQPIIHDNFISPEPSQSDLQMDTSDSQSKGSVSSVTFNPFAIAEETGASPVKHGSEIGASENIVENIFQDEGSMDILGDSNTAPAPLPSHVANIKQDSFDAFAMKFESVAQDENKNGGTFDAFNSNNITADTWGDEKAGDFNESSSGFGPDESFDAFLAMQGPPAQTQNDSKQLAQAGSIDSDDDKDFSVVIRCVLILI